MSGKLLCESCFGKYSECDECGCLVHQEESFYMQEYNETYCEDCFSEVFTNCSKCEQTYKTEELKYIDDKFYCEYCLATCEVCEKDFDRDQIIHGKNDEICCSEKCADETTEI